MSVSAELWRIATAARETDSEQIPAAKANIEIDPELRDPMALLVRQIFLPGTTLKRRHVLFLAVDEQTPSADLAQNAALALAELSTSKVAIIGGGVMPAPKKPPQSVTESRFWRTQALALSDQVWRVPAYLFCESVARQDPDQRRPPAEFRNVFEYFIFAASPESSDLPVFAGLCDTAVLVVTADRTRRDSALHAKELLVRYKIPLLGAVLNGRVLEIPDAIYRRL
jgi:hypothetical protein